MLSLPEVLGEIRDNLSIPDEELTFEQKKTLEEHLDALVDLESQHVDNFSQFVTLNLGQADVLEQEGKRLIERAKAIRNRVALVKSHFLAVMQSERIKKISGSVYTVSIGNSTRVEIPALESEIEKLPIDYVRYITKVEADKNAIKEDLKLGREIPGCKLVETHFLRIR